MLLDTFVVPNEVLEVRVSPCNHMVYTVHPSGFWVRLIVTLCAFVKPRLVMHTLQEWDIGVCFETRKAVDDVLRVYGVPLDVFPLVQDFVCVKSVARRTCFHSDLQTFALSPCGRKGISVSSRMRVRRLLLLLLFFFFVSFVKKA